MKTFLTALLFAGTAYAQTGNSIPTEKFTPLPTGVSDRAFADSSRSNWLGTGARPIRCITWYPSGKQCRTLCSGYSYGAQAHCITG